MVGREVRLVVHMSSCAVKDVAMAGAWPRLPHLDLRRSLAASLSWAGTFVRGCLDPASSLARFELETVSLVQTGFVLFCVAPGRFVIVLCQARTVLCQTQEVVSRFVSSPNCFVSNPGNSVSVCVKPGLVCVKPGRFCNVLC